MRKLRIFSAILVLACSQVLASFWCVSAQDATIPQQRELLVPYSDLHLLLGGNTQRVFMTRSEYDALRAKAKRTPDEKLPQEIVLLSADYEAVLEVGRAVVTGRLNLEVLGEGVHALPLTLSGVGFRSAELDGQPAMLAQDSNGQPLAIVEGRGMHEMRLEMVLPVTTAAAQQSLSWQLPNPPSTKLRLSVPGNVEIKSGAAIANRRIDSDAGVTHFNLLPVNGAMNLVMSLNNRRLRDETTVLARGVIIDEVTQGYERLHANLSMNVLHGASDEFRIAVPQEFEVTQVSTPLLARWSVEDSDDDPPRKILTVKLRELTSERVVINISADRKSPRLENWQMPQFVPLEVAGFASVVGILLEEQLTSEALSAEGLIPIDNQVLTAALPPSVLSIEPGMPRVRPLVTYYAAQAEFELKANFIKQPAQLHVTTNLLLTLKDQGLEVDGGFALLPETEKLFSFEFTVPEGWSVDLVRASTGAPLVFERYPSDTGSRIRVQLPSGLTPGSTTSVLFHATRTPTDWLSDWSEQTLALPVIAITQSESVHESGAIAVRGLDDLNARPEKTSGLIAISDHEKSKYGCGDVPTNLAWRYGEENWEGSLLVTRTTPRVTSRVLSFLQISPESLNAHYELLYDVELARTQRLMFSLPSSTPAEIAIRGLDETLVKETSSQIIEDRRWWSIQLAEKKTGRIRLAVDFMQPLSAPSLRGYLLPDVRAENVAYQSGLVAVEGHAEIDVTAPKHPRIVDMGELIDAEYQVGKRLLGVYSYVGNDGQVTVDAVRRAIHALPTTIVQRAEIVSLVGTGGISQTAARYLLHTKALYLEVRLPERATLWSVLVDGQPALPERQADRVVIALPTAPSQQQRDLQVVYEHPINRVQLRGEVDLFAPTLWQRAERDVSSDPIPLADLRWELILPTGYRVASTGGSVTIDAGYKPRPLSLSDGILWAPATISSPRIAAAKRELDMTPHDLSAMEQLPAEKAPKTDFYLTPSQSIVEQPTSGPPQPTIPPTAAPMMPPQVRAAIPDPQSVHSTSWALQGIRCLAIDLTSARLGESVSFTSLGVSPNLRATLISERRWQWLGAAGGLLVFLIGLLRVTNRLFARIRFAAIVLFGTLLLSPLTGLKSELAPMIEGVFAGSIALVIASFLGLLTRSIRRTFGRTPPASLAPSAIASTPAVFIACAVVLGVGNTAPAQDPFTIPAVPGSVTATNVDALSAPIDVIPSPAPLVVPADAIVIPYDPDYQSIAATEKLLVPYVTYVDLWNAAHPDQRLTTKPAAAPFAWSGAEYTSTLNDADDLKITGRIGLHVLTESAVIVPLTLAGGFLENVTVDGSAARLQMVEAATAQPSPQAEPGKPVPNPADSLMLLHLSGKGRKQVVFEIRMKVERRGGWHVIDGRLPNAPATKLRLEVPKPQTEIRLSGPTDRAVHETEAANETIETALPNGRVSWQWRAKIAEAAVDQGLSVESRAVFDIQEDGLKLAWRGSFEFRRGRRESFTLLVPGSYSIEKVVGPNIRGWSTQPLGDDQQLTVDLLTTVAERETLTLFLFQARDVAKERASPIVAPVIRVPDAMLQRGQLAVRRSSLLELRTSEVAGLARIDTPDNSQWLSEQLDASPLPLKPYQAFQHSQVPFQLQLSAEPIAARTNVTAQTLLNLSQLESALESKLLVEIQDRPLHHLRIAVPVNWKLQTPQAPVEFEWTTQTDAGQQWVDIYFSAGVKGTIPIVLRGPLNQALLPSGTDGSIPIVPLPKIDVQSVARQSGDIVVTSDPAFDVRVEQLQSAEPALLGTADAWLATQHKPLARLLIHYSDSDISGQLKVSLRAPKVTAFSVTNVKLTDRAIEETLFFEFTIRSAGVRQISLVVPASMAQSRVRGPLVRSQTWTPLTSEAGAPVRLLVELQEEVMGQYSLILENDRVLVAGEQSVPIPVIETGTTEHRFVTLENAGRDELLIARNTALERLERSHAQWRFLSNMLGGKATEAFVVREKEDTPALSFTTKDRAVVETVGARIGIAQTLLVVDDNGAYRATQEYRMENRTEQFLEIELPEGAQLWTVFVAGEPVKPMLAMAVSGSPAVAPVLSEESPATPVASPVSSPAGKQRVRIPLVKTATGDLDYPVTLKYGGQMTRPGSLRTTTFPLIKTVNIHVELSQVRLRLPDTKHWLNFSGSMGRVQSEDELTAGWISFRTRQLNELTQLLSKVGASDFSKARATSNLKQLGKEVEIYQNRAPSAAQGNAQLQEQLESNTAAWFQAQQQLQQSDQASGSESAQVNNRALLNKRFSEQHNQPSVNVANANGFNFDTSASTVTNGTVTGEFDAKWLAGNSLKAMEATEDARKSQAADRVLDRKDGANYGRFHLPEGKSGDRKETSAKPAAPKIETQPPVRPKASEEVVAEDRAGQVYRYQQRLEQQQIAGGTELSYGIAPLQRKQIKRDAAASASSNGNFAASEEAKKKIEGLFNRHDQPGTGPAGMETGSMLGGSTPISATGRGGMGGGAMGGGAMGGGAMGSAIDGRFEPSDALMKQEGTTAPPGTNQTGHLASLDTELPVRGTEFLFTTPRGEIEITAQSISVESIDRLTMIAALVGIAILVWLATRTLQRQKWFLKQV